MPATLAGSSACDSFLRPNIRYMSTTHFGFENVDESEKARRVRGVFDSVATRYDLMNDLM